MDTIAATSSRRRHLSARGLGIAGLTLLLTAFVTTVLLTLSQLGGYGWADDTHVKDDGEPHRVPVAQGATGMIWANEATVAPDCSVVDASTDSVLPLTKTDGSYRRSGGSIGDNVGIATFVATSDDTRVTCEPTGADPYDVVYVDKAPGLPPLLAYLGPLTLVPLALGGIGLLACLGALARRLRP